MSSHRPRDLMFGLGCVLVIGISFALKPSPAGWGTHQRLLLPPCYFRLLTAKPCATCGLTTSFCNIARGRFETAFHANPAGLVFFPFTVVFGAMALAGALSRRSFIERILSFGGTRAWLVVVPTILVLWAWQLLH